MIQEEWKGLVYQDIDLSYKMEISNFGNLRNIKTKKLYSQLKNKRGYKVHCTSLGSRGSKKLIRIHVAVATMFIENKENKQTVNHIDGNKENNYVDNLEWATGFENMRHAMENNLIKGTLSDEDVKLILKLYKKKDKKYGAKGLGILFKTSEKTIFNIVNNLTYKWVERE